MIQRIQSTYLLTAFLVMELAAWRLFVTAEIMLGGFQTGFAGIEAIVGLAGLSAIFLFRNRILQAKVVGALRVACAVLVLLLWGLLYFGNETSALAESGILGIVGIAIAPVAAVIAFHMAHRGIRRDIELVRSMDRIR